MLSSRSNGIKVVRCDIVHPPPISVEAQLLLSGSSRRDGIVRTHKWRSRIKWFVAFAVLMLSMYSVYTIQKYQLSQVAVDSTSSKGTVSYGPEGWADVKLLIYMTTHLPKEHIAFLPCWKDAIQRLDIFKYADLMLYTSTKPTRQHLKHLPFKNITIKMYKNPGYQSGATQAMIDPFVVNNTTWFDDYDWVIRINLDVLIRDDKWLMQTMLRPSVDLIVHECISDYKFTPYPLFHTDFFAFRPRAVDRVRLKEAYTGLAEVHFTYAFRHLYDQGRFVYVQGAKNAVDGTCRIEGVGSPVLHVHELTNYCPYYYNITKEGFY